MSAEARLKELGLQLPPRRSRAESTSGRHRQQPVLRVGPRPVGQRRKFLTRRVGSEIDEAAGKAAAKQCALVILTTLKTQLGSLDRIKRVIKTLGMVNAAPDFKNHPAVINGFSEVFAQVFGEETASALAAPWAWARCRGNISVEVEIILELNS